MERVYVQDLNVCPAPWLQPHPLLCESLASSLGAYLPQSLIAGWLGCGGGQGTFFEVKGKHQEALGKNLCGPGSAIGDKSACV